MELTILHKQITKTYVDYVRSLFEEIKSGCFLSNLLKVVGFTAEGFTQFLDFLKTIKAF